MPTPVGRQSLPRREILRGKRAFEYVFEHAHPIRVGVLNVLVAVPFPADWADAPIPVAFSAPKRRFRHAHQRNRLKRLMREAYRQNRSLLVDRLNPEHPPFVLMFIYRNGEVVPFQRVERSLRAALHRIYAYLETHPEFAPHCLG